MVERGWDVVGTVHQHKKNLESLEGAITLRTLDLADREAIGHLILETRPEAVIHLGGQAYIGSSWDDPLGTFDVNILSAFHLLETLRKTQGDPVVIMVGSSAEYGHGHGGNPISEEAPFRPGSPYGVSKVGQEMLGYMFWRRYGMRVIRVRPFAIIGPRKERDAVSEFAQAIVRIERRQADRVAVGDLEVVRDFLDVRDCARALLQVLEQGRPGQAYNVCSGTGTRLRDLLDGLAALAQAPVTLVPDPNRLRSADDPVLIGDSSRLRALGWQPLVPLPQTLRDTMEFWRATDAACVTR